ncbi:MAG: hypothetical protein AABZ25_12290, partial [Nitrospirota bacterium]
MPKILLIGSGIFRKDYEDILSQEGFEVSRFRAIDNALPRLNEKVNIIIVEKEQSKNSFFKDFIKASGNIPKLVVSPDYSFTGLGVWLKNPLTYPVYNPSQKELLYFINRILKEKSMRIENKILQQELDIAKKEIEFFEKVAKILTSSMELNQI